MDSIVAGKNVVAGEAATEMPAVGTKLPQEAPHGAFRSRLVLPQ